MKDDVILNQARKDDVLIDLQCTCQEKINMSDHPLVWRLIPGPVRVLLLHPGGRFTQLLAGDAIRPITILCRTGWAPPARCAAKTVVLIQLFCDGHICLHDPQAKFYTCSAWLKSMQVAPHRGPGLLCNVVVQRPTVQLLSNLMVTTPTFTPKSFPYLIIRVPALSPVEHHLS